MCELCETDKVIVGSIKSAITSMKGSHFYMDLVIHIEGHCILIDSAFSLSRRLLLVILEFGLQFLQF